MFVITVRYKTEMFQFFPWGQQRYFQGLLPCFGFLLLFSRLCPSESYLTQTSPHTRWVRLSSSALVRWACSLRPLLVSASGAWGLGTDLHPWELLPQCESGGAGLHGWLNTEEHSGPPVSQRERLTHNEGSSILYELHHHSDCVLKYGSVECQV